jgi:hypothetical protein
MIYLLYAVKDCCWCMLFNHYIPTKCNFWRKSERFFLIFKFGILISKDYLDLRFNILYRKLINAIRKGIINENKVVKKKNPNPFERTANHNLAIAGARELGCNIINISAEDLNQGKVCKSDFSSTPFDRKLSRASY